jgi:hypothetical protein
MTAPYFVENLRGNFIELTKHADGGVSTEFLSKNFFPVFPRRNYRTKKKLVFYSESHTYNGTLHEAENQRELGIFLNNFFKSMNYREGYVSGFRNRGGKLSVHVVIRNLGKVLFLIFSLNHSIIKIAPKLRRALAESDIWEFRNFSHSLFH